MYILSSNSSCYEAYFRSEAYRRRLAPCRCRSGSAACRRGHWPRVVRQFVVLHNHTYKKASSKL